MIRRFASVIPSPVIRSIGRLQFAVPAMGPLIRRLGAFAACREGIISAGAGKGLRFDSRESGKPGYLLGTTEIEQQNFLAKTLSPGQVFYDLGAHYGFFAMIGARLVGSDGAVYAFEPFPKSAERVRKNAKSNEFTQVEVTEAAVTDVDGQALLVIDEAGSEQNALRETCEKGLQVSTVGIDSWRARSGARPPNLMMIDVEGAEIAVLRGMQETIRQFHPILQIEVHWLGQKFHEAFEKYLAPHGYTLSSLNGDGPPSDASRWQALAVPR